jgi:hypothetical protein
LTGLKTNKNFWIYLLSAIIYFGQGIEGLPTSSITYLWKETLHFNESKIMYLSSLIGLAWVLKPIIGIIIDIFLTKKTWIILSVICSLLGSTVLGVSPSMSVLVTCIMLAILSTNAAIRDIANDGMAVCHGKDNNVCGQIQSVQWVSITLAGVFTGLGGGWIAEKFNYQTAYLLLIPFYLLLLYTVSQYKSTTKNKKDTFIKELKSYGELFTNKKFLIACLFLFLYKFSPSFGTPLFFIERDTFQWSKIFIGAMGTLSAICSIFGAILYYKMCNNINLKKWLIISVIFGATTSIAYLYFTPVTDILYNILFSIAGMVTFLIIMSWMAKTSINGKEATSFAVLCAISNLSGTASSFTGAWLLPIVGLKTLIIISSLTSFLCLPLINSLGLDTNKKDMVY